MCGIVGVAGAIYAKESNIFEDLLFMDTLRGFHGTGIVKVTSEHYNSENYTTSILKKAVPAYEMLLTKEYKTLFEGAFPKCIIGHNRHATQGGICDENSHPFDFDKVVGVHNGSLISRGDLEKGEAPFAVDSEQIFFNINKIGPEKTAPLLDGAFALVWWDKENNLLRFMKNERRPLYYCFSLDDKTLFWASERGMLASALARNNTQTEKIIPLENHLLYSFKIPKVGETFGLPVVRAVKKYEEKTTYKDFYSKFTSQWNTNPFPKDKKKDKKNKNKEVLTIFREGYNGTRLYRSEFAQIVKHGCAWCSESNVSFDDKDILFIEKDEFLCSSCVKDNHVREYLSQAYPSLTYN